jgi:hypothetical protein
MRSLPTAVENAFEANGIAPALLVQFVFPEGTYGLWTGRGLLEWNGFTYKGIDRIIGFSGDEDTSGNEARGAILSLSQIPADRVPDDWFESLENLTYDNAPCNLTWLAFDIRTHELLGLLKFTAYEIDTVSYPEGGQGADGVSEISIEIALETANRNLEASTGTRRSDEDQKRHNDPADRAFEKAAVGNRYRLEFGQIRG